MGMTKDAMAIAIHDLIIGDALFEINQNTVDELTATGALLTEGPSETLNDQDIEQRMVYRLNPDHAFTAAEVAILMGDQ